MPDYLSDPDSATNGIPNFADDASFGGSGDDYVVTGSDGAPLLANTGNARDWLRDTLAGRSSVDEEDFGGTFTDPTQDGESVDIPLRDTGSSGGSGSTTSPTGGSQTSFDVDALQQALASMPSPSPASSSGGGLLGGSAGLIAVVSGAVALVLSLASSSGSE
ncbi:hypothetical protein C2R22_10735 [Salinigranum rubrum]|uniref:Uncharacterized protein n=1 Tax=Salinigranum rubrum TaxID=755307 RepID=A0A2I8VJI1_9EURY|nr:hypothetical protein [Salinigranum rubrum]AUV82065.1 hypothetical protein C2R22_10735 [Salinigranum rubrum]